MSICVVARCRDERNIVEWVEHYMSLHFDHAIIYDDVSVIPVNIPIHLQNSCTVIRASKHVNLLGPAFDAIMKVVREKKFEFILDVDMDEYLYIGKFKSVQEMLGHFEPVDMIKINRLNFGPNGHVSHNDKIDGTNCKEAFTKCRNKLTSWGKCIARVSKIQHKHDPHSFGMLHKSIIKDIEGNITDGNPASEKVNLHVASNDSEVDYDKLPICIFHYSVQDLNTFINRKFNINSMIHTNYLKNRINDKFENMNSEIREKLICILQGTRAPETESEKKVLKAYLWLTGDDLINKAMLH